MPKSTPEFDEEGNEIKTWLRRFRTAIITSAIVAVVGSLLSWDIMKSPRESTLGTFVWDKKPFGEALEEIWNTTHSPDGWMEKIAALMKVSDDPAGELRELANSWRNRVIKVQDWELDDLQPTEISGVVQVADERFSLFETSGRRGIKFDPQLPRISIKINTTAGKPTVIGYIGTDPFGLPVTRETEVPLPPPASTIKK